MATVECDQYVNLPEPCVPDRIGPCPPEPSSSSPSSSDAGGCIRGFRNCPPILLPGFRISILRYVYIPESVDPDPPFIHSYHAWDINSDGKFNRVIADNNKTPAQVHFDVHKPADQVPDQSACESSAVQSSSGSSATYQPNSVDVSGWTSGDETDIDEGVDTHDGNATTIVGNAGDSDLTVGFPNGIGATSQIKLRFAARQDVSVIEDSTMSVDILIDGNSVASTGTITPLEHATDFKIEELTASGSWTAAEMDTLQLRFTIVSASGPSIYVTAVDVIATSSEGGAEPSSSSDESSELTAGAQIRFMGFQMQGQIVSCSDDLESEASSVVSSDEYSETREVRFPAETFTCLDPDADPQAFLLEDTDPALTNTISEGILELDSDGSVNKVFAGGQTNCGTHELKWHKHNPPTDTNTGFAINVVSQEEPGSALEDTWGVWKLHFDSKGQFLYACAIVRFCGCEPTCSHPWCDSSDQQPFCVCRDLCLLTDGCQGIGSEPADCPATVTIDCSLALVTDCVNKILEAGNCVYTYTGQCRTCADEPSETLVSTVESSLTEGCFYPSGDSVIDCVTTNDPV